MVTATLPNSRAWRAAEIPGGNGHGTARALAGIYGAMVRKSAPIITPATLAEATRPRFKGPDAGNGGQPTAFGAGFRLEDPEYGPRASPRSFGHAGWGGSIAFADPDARLGFAFVTNHLLGFPDVDPRRGALVDAVYEGLSG